MMISPGSILGCGTSWHYLKKILRRGGVALCNVSFVKIQSAVCLQHFVEFFVMKESRSFFDDEECVEGCCFFDVVVVDVFFDIFHGRDIFFFFGFGFGCFFIFLFFKPESIPA